MFHKGDQIGPYTLVRQLGRGQFGVVWLGERHGRITTTTVAIKFPSNDEIDLAGIRREAELWVKASGHPNVLPIIEADVYALMQGKDATAIEQIAIVSEYAPDGSLGNWLKQHGGKAPSNNAAVELTLGILAGLNHLHTRQPPIIHRDLKPDNILLQGETPRLADFGIARVLRTTSSTGVAGSPAYMAPEAFNGRRSEQTDLWSVGILLYQLLTGGLPFQQSDVASLIKAIVLDTPIRLPSLFPDSLQRIVDCALQKDLARRYRSAGEMRIALQEAIKPTSQNKKKLASRKLYVGNLSFRVSAQDLLELFLQVGIVESASVVEDSETGRARGFGFVEMSTPEEAEYAMEMFNGKEFFGRNLIVNEAKRENLRRDRMPTW